MIQCYPPIAEHQDEGDDDDDEDDQIQYLSGGTKQKRHMQKNDHQTNKKLHIQHTTVTKPDLANLSPRCVHAHTCMHLKNIQRYSILIDICSLLHEGLCESSKVDFCLCSGSWTAQRTVMVQKIHTHSYFPLAISTPSVVQLIPLPPQQVCE